MNENQRIGESGLVLANAIELMAVAMQKVAGNDFACEPNEQQLREDCAAALGRAMKGAKE